MQQATIVHFPKVPLAGAIGLLVVVVLSVAMARYGGMPVEPGFSTDQMVQKRILSFSDQPDGSILISETETGNEVARAAPGTNGFLRGFLRGLMRVRKTSEVELTAPFILASWSKGTMTLEDTVTGVKVDLKAFGPTNAAVFDALLPKIKEGSRQ